MGTIKLQNIRTFSFHGCLEEEGRIGSDYRVDLEVKTDLRKSALSDDLKDTVDYVHLNKIVVEEMAIRSKLLEHVAGRIISRVEREFSAVKSVKLKITKTSPPMKGECKGASVYFEKKIQ